MLSAAFPRCDVLYAADFDGLPVPRPVANHHSRVADDLIGEIEHEHAPIGFRPNHIPPGESGDNLRRPDRPEQWRGVYDRLIEFKVVWDDERRDVTITGRVPVPDASDLESTGSEKKYCKRRVHATGSIFTPIPFEITKRVA